jgi:biotin transport system substrate-specific component
MTNTPSSQLGYAVRLQTGAMMVALISAGAFISIPIPGSPVPIVLQNMFVILAGMVLSPGWAALTVGVYLVLGAVGLPVFAGATGGLAHLAGPTGGFLIGFPIAAAVVAGILQKKDAATVADTSLPRQALSLIVGFMVMYATGVPWLALTAGLSFPQAIAAGMLPFIPGDIIKMMVLLLLVRSVPNSVWRMLN